MTQKPRARRLIAARLFAGLIFSIPLSFAGGLLGDAAGFAGRLVFGPSIDDAEQAGDRVTDRMHAQLEALLSEADKGAGAQVTDLGSVLSEALTSASKDAEREIDRVSEEAKSKGRLYKFLADQEISVLGWTLRDNTIWMGFAAFIIVVMFFVLMYLRDRDRAREQSSTPAPRRATLLPIGLGISVVLAAIFFLIVRHANSPCTGAADLAANTINEYWQSYAALHFTKASDDANGLKEWSRQCAKPQEAVWEFRSAKAELLQRIFSKPGSYAQKARLSETVSDLGQILKSHPTINPESLEASDVRTAQALVQWDAYDTRPYELQAAKFAAFALIPLTHLTLDEQRTWKQAAPLAPLAIHYLMQYLERPLSKVELRSISASSEDVETAARFPEIARQGARMIETSYKNTLHDYPFFPYIQYGQWSGHLIRLVVPAYVCLVHENTMAELTIAQPAESQTHLDKRDTCADTIVSAYEGPPHPDRPSLFVTTLMDDKYNDTSVRLSALFGINAIYDRAKAYAHYKIRGPGRPAIKSMSLYLPVMPPEIQPIAPLRDPTLAAKESPALQLLDALPDVEAGPHAKKALKVVLEGDLVKNAKDLQEFEASYLESEKHALNWSKSLPPAPGAQQGTLKPADPAKIAEEQAYEKTLQLAGRLSLFVCTDTFPFACGEGFDSENPIPVSILVQKETSLKVESMGAYQSAQSRPWRVP